MRPTRASYPSLGVGLWEPSLWGFGRELERMGMGYGIAEWPLWLLEATLPKLGLRERKSFGATGLPMRGAGWACLRCEAARLLEIEGAGAAAVGESAVRGRRSGEISLSSGTALGGSDKPNRPNGGRLETGMDASKSAGSTSSTGSS
jgi:hypothetical protein